VLAPASRAALLMACSSAPELPMMAATPAICCWKPAAVVTEEERADPTTAIPAPATMPAGPMAERAPPTGPMEEAIPDMLALSSEPKLDLRPPTPDDISATVLLNLLLAALRLASSIFAPMVT